jgi:Cof subfamily protein (haloacid dehalogenase superfamily)
MPLQLVCLDVDGTLVGSSGQPSEQVWTAAGEARAAGLHLAICTARLGAGTAWEWAVRLDPNGWHQFQTGASLIHTGSQQSSSTPLPSGAARACQKVAAENGWIFECYADTDYIVDSDDPVAMAHANLLGISYVRRCLSDLVGTPLRTQLIVADRDLEAAVRSVPFGCMGSSATSPIIPGYNFVSITTEGVTKASGVTAIAAMIGCDLQDVMMVGDGQNDVSAMQIVGHPVAMGNAHSEAAAAARHHVDDVENDGAAVALRLAISLRNSLR